LEGENTEGIFTSVRNPFSHGPGDAELVALNLQQTEWAIDFCMIWIKTLVRRL
jgi:hypothetical protein